MTDEKWYDLLDNIEAKFGTDEKYTEPDDLTDDLGNVAKGEKEVVIFNGPIGKVKLERITRPLIEDKKMHYHKGAGGTARVEFILSKEEKTHSLKAFTFDDGTNDWKELELPGGSVTF